MKPRHKYGAVQTVTDGITCGQCGTVFAVKPSRAGKAKYCSIPCHNLAKKTQVAVVCDACGKGFSKFPCKAGSEKHYCSQACKHSHMNGENHGKWAGGITDERGYVGVRVGPGKRKSQHRLVMEAAIGRSLLPNEVVHHINHNKSDNRPENLQLVTPAEHSKIHADENRPTTWAKNFICCRACGNDARKHAGRGLCLNCYMTEFREARRAQA